MTEFEIAGEGEGLVHGVVTPGLEHHHGDGPAGKGVPDDEFSDNVQSNLLVCNSLDHTTRDGVQEGCA